MNYYMFMKQPVTLEDQLIKCTLLEGLWKSLILEKSEWRKLCIRGGINEKEMMQLGLNLIVDSVMVLFRLMYDHSNVRTLLACSSDHHVLAISVAQLFYGRQDKLKRPDRIEPWWFQHEQCNSLIQAK